MINHAFSNNSTIFDYFNEHLYEKDGNFKTFDKVEVEERENTIREERRGRIYRR